MREKWDEAISNLDEKYINETAQTLAKHTHKQAELEQFENDGSRPTSVTKLSGGSKSRRGMYIGIGAAAAIVLAIGAGIRFGGGLGLLSQSTPTQEISQTTEETDETAEYDVPETEDGVISFSETYREGRLVFTPPQLLIGTGANVSIAGPVSDLTEDEIFSFIGEFSGLNAYLVNENLLNNGYVLDKERSHWNSTWNNSTMPGAAKIGRQMTLCYTNGSAMIRINIGNDSGANFAYVRTASGKAYLPSEETSGSYLRWNDSHASGKANADVRIGGVTEGGVAAYCAEFDWTHEGLNGLCRISANGCQLEDVTEILAGFICNTAMLHPASAEPFAAGNYDKLVIKCGLPEMQLEAQMTEKLAQILKSASQEPLYDDSRELEKSEKAELRCHRRGKAADAEDILCAYKGRDGRYYYGITDYESQTTAYFELEEGAYSELFSWFCQYTPSSFIATVLSEYDGNVTDADSGRYLVKGNSGEVYSIVLGTDERFAPGDTVEVGYYGDVMETSPAMVNLLWVRSAYNMDADTAQLIPEGMAEMGFDFAVFEKYFCCRWNSDENELFLSYCEPAFAQQPVCFALEDGFCLGYYNEVAAELCFIPESNTEMLYRYYVECYDERADLTLSRNRGYTRYLADYDYRVITDFRSGGYANGMGLALIANTLGGNSADVINEALSDFTDENGDKWIYRVSNLVDESPWVKHLDDNSVQMVVGYASQAAYDAYFAGGDLVRQTFLCSIELHNGSYALTSREKCNSMGVVSYDIESDSTRAFDDGITDIDFTAYEQYFIGEWQTDSGSTLTLDYNSGNYEDCLCGKTDKGVVMIRRIGGKLNELFIPYDETGTMYSYTTDGSGYPMRKDYSAVYKNKSRTSSSMQGSLNYMGRKRLANYMGGNFDELLDGLISDGFVDSEGVHWSYNGPSSILPYCVESHIGLLEWNARICLPYTDGSRERYFLHRIDTVSNWTLDNGADFRVFYSVPCDENGVVDFDAVVERSYIGNIFNYDHVLKFTDEYTLRLCWFVSGYTNSVLDAELRLVERDTGRLVHRETVRSPEMLNGCGSDETMFALNELRLKDGTIAAVRCGNTASLYVYDESTGGLRLADIIYVQYDRAMSAAKDTNVFSYVAKDEGLVHAEFDFKTLTLKNHTVSAEDMTITPDFGKAQQYDLGNCISNFFGEWQSGRESLDINLYNTDLFSYSDPCIGFYKDDSGYYMLGESRVWFVPAHNRQQMYYFENVKRGAELKLADGKLYTSLREALGYDAGEGERGYLGLIDLCAQLSESGTVDIESLFDIGFTDESGTRWVRTPDRSVDWGGMYKAKLYNSKYRTAPHNVTFLKMMNSADPSQMKWFSFDFSIGENGRLTWSDEHYSFDMSVFSVDGLTTEFADSVRTKVHSGEYGWFDLSVKLFVIPGSEHYYAMRTMGSNQSQWINNHELFCYQNGSYTLITDEWGDPEVLSGNALYMLYTDDNGIMLEVYNGTQLVESRLVAQGDYNFNIGSSAELFGRYPTYYLVVGYYDSEIGGYRAAVYDVSQGITPLGVYADSDIILDTENYLSLSIKNPDGTITTYGG